MEGTLGAWIHTGKKETEADNRPFCSDSNETSAAEVYLCVNHEQFPDSCRLAFLLAALLTTRIFYRRMERPTPPPTYQVWLSDVTNTTTGVRRRCPGSQRASVREVTDKEVPPGTRLQTSFAHLAWRSVSQTLMPIFKSLPQRFSVRSETSLTEHLVLPPQSHFSLSGRWHLQRSVKQDSEAQGELSSEMSQEEFLPSLPRPQSEHMCTRGRGGRSGSGLTHPLTGDKTDSQTGKGT